MTVWPFLPVWPFLIMAAALCSVRNAPAGISIILCLILVRAVIYFELNNPQVLLIALYSTFAVIVLFFVDKTAGGFFALVSAALALFVLGFVSHRFEMIASEVILVAGICASAYFGPTGGLFTRADKDRPVHHSGLGNSVAMVSSDSQEDHRGD